MNYQLEEWESKLDDLLAQIDNLLEDEYAGKFTIHPNRPRRGQTLNPSEDGIIEIECKFSLGLGSKYGEGYIIRPLFSTLEYVDKKMTEKVTDFVKIKIEELLPDFFPDNNLSIDFDGKVLKIFGDLNFNNS
jgi:hypothetical protein